MTQEQLVSEARGRLGTTSATDRTIENFFSNPAFCPAEGTEPDESYWTRTIDTLKWFSTNYDGQHNHAMSTAHAAWEEQYKKDHPELFAKPLQPEDKKPEDIKPEPLTEERIAKIVAEAIAKNNENSKPSNELIELQKQMKAMQDEKAEAEAKTKVDAIYSGVKAKIISDSNNGVNMALLEDAIEYIQLRGSVTKDTSAEVAEKMIRDRYEKQYARHNPGGDAPYGIASVGANEGKTYAQKWQERHENSRSEQQKIVEAQRSRFK